MTCLAAVEFRIMFWIKWQNGKDKGGEKSGMEKKKEEREERLLGNSGARRRWVAKRGNKKK